VAHLTENNALGEKVEEATNQPRRDNVVKALQLLLRVNLIGRHCESAESDGIGRDTNEIRDEGRMHLDLVVRTRPPGF